MGPGDTQNQDWLYWWWPAAIYLTDHELTGAWKLPELSDSKVWLWVLWSLEITVLASPSSNLQAAAIYKPVSR
jgi:hypothetical protein